MSNFSSTVRLLRFLFSDEAMVYKVVREDVVVGMVGSGVIAVVIVRELDEMSRKHPPFIQNVQF